MATINTVYYIPTLLGLTTTFGISCTIAIVCVTGFELLRSRKSMQSLFAPRTRLQENSTGTVSPKPFGWLTGSIKLDEAWMIDHVGLDAAMYLRFLRMAVQFLALLALLLCPTLLSVHWQSTPTLSNDDEIAYFHSNATLFRLSISNVPDDTPIVWIHAAFVFLISLGWLWLLFANHCHLLQQPQKRSYTVLVTNVPHHLRNVQALRQHFSSEVGPVDTVSLLSQAGAEPLQLALQRRMQHIDRLERLLIVLGRRCITPNWIQSIPPHHGIVDLLDKIDDIDREIERLRELNHMSARYCTPTGTAFVTFKSIESARLCAQIVTSWKPGVFQTQLAPEPRDVMWEGLLRRGRRDKVMSQVKRWTVFVAVWSLTIFWLFPVSFILSLTSIESLSQHLGFLDSFLASSTLVRSFVQHVLPMLLVTLFMSLLPWILFVLSKQQDFVSYSELEDAVLCRYYRFAIFNVLIVFLLGTTFLSTMLDVLHEPARVIHLLAKFLPQGANFFLSYILFNSSSHAMELLQLGSQLFGHLIASLPFISNTPRKLSRHTQPWSFPFYYYYPNHILVFVIAMTYSVIQPLILLFALLYFSLALVCFRHQFAYCYVRRYESNGFLYQRMAGYTSDGLLIFQMTVMGLLYLKGVWIAATAIIPLSVFTVWAKIKLSKQYMRSTTMTRPQLPDIVHANPVDDIWKLSYLKTWYVHGRYGIHQQITTPRSSSRSSSITIKDMSHLEDGDGSSNDNKEEDIRPLTLYPSDQPRYDDGFAYPPLVEQLERRLWLPRDPGKRQWNLDDCIPLTLDELSQMVDKRHVSGQHDHCIVKP